MRVKTSADFLQERKFPWKLLAAFIAVLLVIAVGGMLAGILWTGGNLERALEMGRLTELPESATEVQIGGTGNVRAATFYICFSAPPEDIDGFITGSRSIGHLHPEQLSAEHMYLPARARSEDVEEAARHVYFQPDTRYPWYDPTVRTRGRRYVIPENLDGNSGEVIIDDDRHIVYVRVVRG
ncbi:MAG: hypothetical protein ABIG44_00175 [Planctomycetota bacterium]